MAKCKNKVIHVKIKGKPDCRWESFYAGQEVPSEWVKPFLEQGGQLEEEGVVEKKPTPVVEKKPVETQPYTEDEVYSWNRKEQLDYLKEKDIKPARTEKGRVKQILEAQ